MFDLDPDKTHIDNLIALSTKPEAKEHGICLCLNANELIALVAEIQQLQSYCGELEADLENSQPFPQA